MYTFRLYCDVVPSNVRRWFDVYGLLMTDGFHAISTSGEFASDFAKLLIESGISFSVRKSSGFRSVPDSDVTADLTADLPEPSEFSSCETDDLIRPVF